MKTRIIVTILLSLAIFSARAFSAELGTGRMGIVQGAVQIYTEDAGEWVPAAINTPLSRGDRIWAPFGGRSELQFQGGLVIRLDALTAFDILSLNGAPYQFYVNTGRIYVNNRTQGIDYLQLDTPVASIGSYDNSIIMIRVEENSATEVSVLKGYAYAETRDGKIRVPAGKTLRIEESLKAEIFPMGDPDEWEEWNRELDGRIGYDGASLRYLPDELYDYGYDFDTYGRWSYDTSYGYVWTPTFSISIGWAPYRVGRWVWIGGNYVWISHEPWGWAPYHYGRWIHRRHVGWCWVPPRRGAVYWGPGYVGWVYTPTLVAWVPLAPGDIYFGHGYYGPGSVNINTINNIMINRNYINLNTANAVTTRYRDTFLHGGNKRHPVWKDPFRQRNVGMGPPRFKPDRATFAPALKKIPTENRPPRRIRQFNPKTVQEKRKPVPDKGGSVFSPGRPAGKMPTTIREKHPEVYGDRPGKTPPTVTMPTTRGIPRKTPERKETERSRQPAAVKAAPRPVAPQPVAPTPIWSPSPTRQPGKSVSPVRRPATSTPAPKVRRPVPTTVKPAAQPKQSQQPSQTPRGETPVIRTRQLSPQRTTSPRPPVIRQTAPTPARPETTGQGNGTHRQQDTQPKVEGKGAAR